MGSLVMDERASLNSMMLLTATNYSIWKPRMKDLLILRDLYDSLDFKGIKPESIPAVEWKKKNRMAVSLIRQCIGQEVFPHLSDEEDAWVLWTKLETMFQSKTSRNKALLMRRLVKMELKYDVSIAEHTSKFQSLVNQLATVGMNIDGEMQALLLLSSLPDSWETLVVSLNNSAPEGEMTLESVKEALFSEEARRLDKGGGRSENLALFAGKSKKGKQGTSSNSKVGRVVCYHCQEEGHIRRYCPKRKTEVQNQSNVVIEDASNEILVVLEDMDEKKGDWVLDSGCGSHMCYDRALFSEYEATEGIVQMADGSRRQVAGRGTILLWKPSGEFVRLSDVKHVPALKWNLLSLGGLDESRCKFEATTMEEIRILEDNRVVLHGKKVGGIYLLEGCEARGAGVSQLSEE